MREERTTTTRTSESTTRGEVPKEKSEDNLTFRLHMLMDDEAVSQLYGGRRLAISEASTSATIVKMVESLEGCTLLREWEAGFSDPLTALDGAIILLTQINTFNENRNPPVPLKGLLLERFSENVSSRMGPQIFHLSSYGKVPMLLLSSNYRIDIEEYEGGVASSIISHYSSLNVDIPLIGGEVVSLTRLLPRKEKVRTSLRTSRLTFYDGRYFVGLFAMCSDEVPSDEIRQYNPSLEVQVSLKGGSLILDPRGTDLLLVFEDSQPLIELATSDSFYRSTLDCCYQLQVHRISGRIDGCKRLKELHYKREASYRGCVTSDYLHSSQPSFDGGTWADCFAGNYKRNVLTLPSMSVLVHQYGCFPSNEELREAYISSSISEIQIHNTTTGNGARNPEGTVNGGNETSSSFVTPALQKEKLTSHESEVELQLKQLRVQVERIELLLRRSITPWTVPPVGNQNGTITTESEGEYNEDEDNIVPESPSIITQE